jgi:hypothetical protein
MKAKKGEKRFKKVQAGAEARVRAKRIDKFDRKPPKPVSEPKANTEGKS